MLAALCCDKEQRKYFYNVLDAISQSSFSDFEKYVENLLQSTVLEMQDYDSCLVSSKADFPFCTSYNSVSRLNEVFLNKFQNVKVLFLS
jgi:hypothetical protein